jgi:copper transporter 1
MGICRSESLHRVNRLPDVTLHCCTAGFHIRTETTWVLSRDLGMRSTYQQADPVSNHSSGMLHYFFETAIRFSNTHIDFALCGNQRYSILQPQIQHNHSDLQASHHTNNQPGFIARSWRITSQGAFAGSCIGVILLVVLLEFLRRAGKEYDRYIIAQHIKTLGSTTSSASSVDGPSGQKQPTTTTTASPIVSAPRFRPNIFQQAIRALLHMLQFAVAYFVMLLAMYYNGYFIICIFIGAYIGYFIFGYESFNVGQGGRDRMEENATVCCG